MSELNKATSTVESAEKSDGNDPDQEDLFRIGCHTFQSRLIMGTGRYLSFEAMQESHFAGETECVTIAVRRERLHDSSGRNILDFIDAERLVLLPNTAGSYDAETAVRCARMGREILRHLENPGADWVKLEVLGDSRTLLPDPIELLKATEILVADGFDVLCYTSDDPVIARRLKDAGATSVMPAASPIGSGLGILNQNNLRMIIDDLKRDDPDFPVIVDAGIGTASDAAQAMELGFDAVLLNSAVALAEQPVSMAAAMRHAIVGGRLAFHSGRIPKSRYGSASSPDVGVISHRIQPKTD
ncbi:MAG: thiazole synthase [Planctomycetota bacterium]